MRSRFFRAFLVCAALVPFTAVHPRADVIAQPLPFTQNWSNTNLITADNDWSGVPGIIAYRGDAMVSTTGIDPETVVADGSSTPVNVLANKTDTALTTGGIAEFELADPVVALQGSGTARAPHIVITVSTLGSSGIHVAYLLRDIDGTSDNTTSPIALQYRVGTSGSYTNVPEAFVADASSGPSLATLVTPVSVTLPSAVDNQPLVQLRIITTDRPGSDEWIGIDDISVTATGGVRSTSPSGTMTASPSSLNVGDTITLTANVTPGTNPDDSNALTVTGNLSEIGLGNPVFTRVGAANMYTFTGVIPDGVSGGAHSVAASIADTDTPPRTGTTSPATLVTILQATAPTGVASANPNSVPAGSTTHLSVTVTPGTDPDSTGLKVTADLSAIGGSSAQVFEAGANNVFTYTATVDPAIVLGAKTLPVVVSDDQNRSSAASIGLTVTARLADSRIVISQIYPGGGNSGATYTNDFVQLYNRGTTTVDITGWSLQYASAAGSSWSNRQPLAGTIAPGRYYLISLASGGATGASLPDANVLGLINMSNASGKVALLDTLDQLPDGICPVSPDVQDFVGYGTTANCHEGSGNAPAPAPANKTALFRLGGGFVDTNDNSADFTTGNPAPLTTSPIVPVPPQVFITDPTANGVNVPRDGTIEVTFTQAVDLDPDWFDVVCAHTGSHDDATVAVDGISEFITPNVNFEAGETCTATVFKAKVHDHATSTLMPPSDYTWTFTVASGAASPESPGVHLLLGNPSDAATDRSQFDNYLMSKPEYALSYNRDLGRPNWVSWHLTASWIPASHPARVDTFRADPDVPPDWYRVESFDFSGSGFDRGHMTPNADRESSTPVNQATFLMSNMVAQAPDNNQGPWANFENYLRSLVTNDADPAHPNEIYIVSGPVGKGGIGSAGGADTVANGHVTVPASTWKVALVLPDDGAEDDVSRVTCATRTIAVIMPNKQGIRSTPNDPNDWMQYLTTAAAVEQMVRTDTAGGLTQFTLFSNVPPPIQYCIKAGTNGVNPKNDQTISFDPLADKEFGNGDFELHASATSGLMVSFAVTAGPATIVNGNTVHLTGTGLVTITATQTGDVNYNAAPPVIRSFAVVDTTPPAITGVEATPSDIGPPSHKMVEIAVPYTATDLSGQPVCTLSVASNEPANSTGDGNTSVDWQIVDEHQVLLRSERAGTGNGRVYTITATCSDRYGNRSSAITSVTVQK